MRPGFNRIDRRWWLLALLFVLLAWDATRPPQAQVSARLVLLAIDGYQAVLSPLMPRMGVRCRFTPTCSRYAEACVRSHGVARGMWWSARRLLRCGPWSPAGTHDPPPGKGTK